MITDFSASCIICSKTTDLDTSINIKHTSNEAYTVSLCKACEDTSQKIIKEKFIERFAQVEAFIAEAARLGITINKSSPVTAVHAVPATPTKKEIPVDKVVTLSKEMQEYKNEGGRVIAVPKIIKTNAGDTTIRMNKYSDADLQNKFKKQANSLVSNKENAINMQNCGLCQGSGILFQNNIEIECTNCIGAKTTPESQQASQNVVSTRNNISSRSKTTPPGMRVFKGKN